MAILVDFSQIFLSNLLRQANSKYADTIEQDLVRHMVLNSLRAYRSKHYREYGEMIIACDSHNYWRKKLFPNYKAHRKAEREKTKLDWNYIFALLDTTLDELRNNFPYAVVRVDTAEADDVIAVLAKEISKTEKVLILSGDHDFQQLQAYPNITQYNPIKKKYVVSNDPKADLYTHIICGDKGDGVPNILSGDDTYTKKVRASPMRETRLNDLLNSPAIYIDPGQVLSGEELRNFQRNQSLVDLDLIPKDVEQLIVSAYSEASAKPNNRMKIMPFFIKHRMRNLMADINDF